MYYVYILHCREERYYIGSTEDIEKRLAQHNSPEFKGWTSRYHDWKLVYHEAYQTRSEAIKRERQIKRMKGGAGFRRLVGGIRGSPAILK
ncbi:GIY-YIG nuclease family protein [candidate division KSB1 bacterium]|nr:GIY-YIG nuclease family protein [candidate division KSB1 bacterium]